MGHVTVTCCFTLIFFLFSPHKLPSSNMPLCKTARDDRWPFVLTLWLTEGGKMVAFGSWIIYFDRVGSLWGLCAKVDCSWRKNVITPKYKQTTQTNKQSRFASSLWHGSLTIIRVEIIFLRSNVGYYIFIS